ncbi:hypothetical protein MFIFM68171_04207 [Madurella fahalii]|uniref:LIM zinc-binding domain-containing protein n=1 Tax=Madurella fahalii TaxID=1157608 RepID=A0ABQ0G8D3_9PEZI
MATMGRESRFMPTVKCSTCGLQVEISLMGEHVCAGSPAAEPTPPLPVVSLFGRFMPAFGNSNAATEKQQPRAPPHVDTSAANRAFLGQGELTPISVGSASMTPRTPDGRAGAGKTGEYFGPQIVSDSPPRRPGGYGGLDESSGLEPAFSPNPPRKQGPDLMERMNTITPGPFIAYRRPSAGGRSISGDTNDRPGTSASNLSSLSTGKGSRAQRQNGYGGFGTPSRAREDVDEPPLTPNRSESFPRPSDSFAPPLRSPSAPPSASRLRTDRLQPLDSPAGPDGRVPTGERARRPSRGPDTSRPPPPRSAPIRPTTPVVPTINLAEEFGIGNPYHAPSESSSSNGSENGGQLFDRRPSQASQASSRTSPPRSLASRSGGRPSDANGFDNLMSDIQSSMDEMNPKQKPPPLSPLKMPPKDIRDRPSPLSARPPPPERGYDPRIDPAIQNPRYGRGRSPVPSPSLRTPLQNELTVHAPGDILSPASAALPSPRWTRSPERIEDQLPPHQQEPKSARERSRSRARDPAIQPPPSRGNCKACGLAIKGKSISSADGRLTGRYHKPCFVCSTCQEPFSSSTFYVLDDRPYCEQHYHKLNGSLCGSCNRGIEGQYLEDESAVKHHVGCFKCAQCRMALRDGYFEVNGRAYCEKDAWRLVQQPWMANGGMRSPGPGSSPNMGLPGGPRGFGPAGGKHGPSRMGPGPRPRMEKRMTRLGMM